MFVKVRRVFTAGAILFLLGLFILPSLFLRGWSAELNGLCLGTGRNFKLFPSRQCQVQVK